MRASAWLQRWGLKNPFSWSVAQFFLLAIVVAAVSPLASAASRTPLSVIREPESFAEDPDAAKADLAYRVSVRPYFLAPVVMKLYISRYEDPSGKTQFKGRFVVKGIKDGSIDEIQERSSELTPEQLVDLLKTIRVQEVFNLKAEEKSYPEGYDDAGFDPSVWVFERVESADTARGPGRATFTSVSRTQSEGGPARVVFLAFGDLGAELLK